MVCGCKWQKKWGKFYFSFFFFLHLFLQWLLYSLQGLGFIPLPPPSGNNGCSSKLLWPYDLSFFMTSLHPPPPWSLVTTSLKLLSTFCWILVGTDNLRGWITDHWWPFSVHRIQVLYPVYLAKLWRQLGIGWWACYCPNSWGRWA